LFNADSQQLTDKDCGRKAEKQRKRCNTVATLKDYSRSRFSVKAKKNSKKVKHRTRSAKKGTDESEGGGSRNRGPAGN